MADILVIDDEGLVRKTVRLILEHGGHRVFEAADGIAGLAETARRRFDLVISDILMPGQAGTDTIRQLRAAEPALKILAMSGGARVRDEDLLALAAQCGADDVLPKPFEPQELLEKVEALCGKTGGGSQP